MKILITTSSFGKYDEAPLQKLKESGAEVILNPFGKKLSAAQSKELYTQDVDGVIAGTEAITADILKQATGLKVISRMGSGMDNVDLAAAEERKIAVFKTSSVVADAVAELTLTLILNALRQIPLADRSMRNGQWKKPMGYLLKKKTVGLLGTGTIGKRVIELLRPFACQLMACDLTEDTVLAEGHGVIYKPLPDMMEQADVISIHLPYNETTHHLIDGAMINLMKKDGILVNTSRGHIVDETALHDALLQKRIAAAALDVFAEEPYSGPLTKLDNIILTSHIGSYARESRIAMEREAVDNLMNGLNRC